MENWKHYMAAGPRQSAGPSLTCGELPAETCQATLFSAVKMSVVICQVLEKYFTWVKSICNRTQKPSFNLEKKFYVCVCICYVNEV